MTTYYVATNGSNSANGSSATPWKTINYAMARDLKPGDTVIVRPGTYNESVTIDNGGSAAGDVTLKSEVPGGALIRPPAGAWNAVYVWDNYVTVDGFDIQGPANRGDGIEANDVHHISILNNKVHGNGESGIQFNWCEFIRVEGNETYENATSGWFSGISIYQTRNITGDTTTTGYRTIIRNNISHDNVTKTGGHSDGNGIIIDDFQHTQETLGNTPAGRVPSYTYPTLVDGNVVYENGGKGIAVHWSNNVTVSNNTAYHNNQDLKNTGTWRGELSNQDSNNNTWVNNIAVADPDVHSGNTAIGFYGSNSGTKWYNNLTFNGTNGQASVKLEGGNNAAPTAANGNKLGVDPQFVNPANGDFHVKPGSAAIDSGTSSYGVGKTDVGGGPRVIGNVDIGAYEQGSSGGTNRAPDAKDDSGFVTNANTAMTIAASALLANDTDQDGNALSLTGVSGATNGTVTMSGSSVIFTPKAGYTGSAGFTYSISDGKGGSDSATVSLTVNPVTAPNAAPTFTSGTAFSLNENTTAVGTVTARDAEGDALTFSKIGGADAALFNIDAKTGAVTFAKAPDFEKPADADGNNVYVLNVGVTDGKHTTVTQALQITVKNVAETTPPAPSGGSSFFGASATPAQTETLDRSDYELGMKFTVLKEGDITALRYYRGAADAGDTDTRTLHLWSSTGKELAEVTVTSAPGASGWQTATLSSPVHVTANSKYVVSYGTVQNYADSVNYFRATTVNSDGTISVSQGAGVYSEKVGGSGGPDFFPTQSWNSSNYWADVVLKTSAASAGGGSSGGAVTPPVAGLTLTGTAGADTLVGGAGDDILSGLKGNDRLQGNGGADVLRGGGGADTFVYKLASDSTLASTDLISKFTQGVDKIDLSAIDAVTGGNDNAFAWIGSGAFTGAAGQLRIASVADDILLQGDVNGDGVADLAIRVDAASLAASDVLL